MDITDATRLVLGIAGKKGCTNCRWKGERYHKGPQYGSSWCYHQDWLSLGDCDGGDHPCSTYGPTPLILWEPKIDE